MQIANVMLALNGDRGNTVPKTGITPAEAAVLEAIHGEGSVHEIDVLPDEIDREGREVIAELYDRYGAARREDEQVVKTVFPGVTANVPETFHELGYADEQYKALARAVPKPKAKAKKSSSSALD